MPYLQKRYDIDSSGQAQFCYSYVGCEKLLQDVNLIWIDDSGNIE